MSSINVLEDITEKYKMTKTDTDWLKMILKEKEQLEEKYTELCYFITPIKERSKFK